MSGDQGQPRMTIECDPEFEFQLALLGPTPDQFVLLVEIELPE